MKNKAECLTLLTVKQLEMPGLPEKTKVFNHPAKYSDSLLAHFHKMLAGSKTVLDPFAGTGKLAMLKVIMPNTLFTLLELEPEWATMLVGNALKLPFGDNTFEAVCTSPTYGNRMADTTYDSQNGNEWQTYTCKLGRHLHSDNSGQMQWGDNYRDFHRQAWQEISRVVKQDGVIVLNIKDHIRNWQVQPVTDWHADTIIENGFDLVEWVKVDTPSMRYGKNSELRVGYESIVKFIRRK